MTLQIKYYSIFIIGVLALIWGQFNIVSILLLLSIQSLCSFQAVQVIWKEIYVEGVLVWINSFEEKQMGQLD